MVGGPSFLLGGGAAPSGDGAGAPDRMVPRFPGWIVLFSPIRPPYVFTLCRFSDFSVL